MNDLDRHLSGIAAGDVDAFGRWLAEAESPLRNSLRRFAASVDTEAVLQESLLRVWQVAPRFEPDGRPNGLLRLGYRITRNLAISEVRRARVKPVDPALLAAGIDAQTQSMPAPPDPHLRAQIERCRDQLPARPALALDARLSSRGGVPDADLATSLGMKRNTFVQNISRARKLLADCLEKHGVDLALERV